MYIDAMKIKHHFNTEAESLHWVANSRATKGECILNATGLPEELQVWKGPGGYQIVDGPITIHVAGDAALADELGRRIVAALERMGKLRSL